MESNEIDLSNPLSGLELIKGTGCCEGCGLRTTLQVFLLATIMHAYLHLVMLCLSEVYEVSSARIDTVVPYTGAEI